MNVIRRGRLRLGRRRLASHFALAFGDDVESDGFQEEAGQRRSKVRESFNSPFWPFVLATTSVGQEGLDFHLFCRDVVHWNLPTNPVDFEQREGRINRYAGLWIRRAIAEDYSLSDLLRARADAKSPWPLVFELAERSDRVQRYKHGLFPYWVYEARHDRGKVSGRTGAIRRHVFFHEHSEDAENYKHLLHGLNLYRLVFGQPNQRDLLRSVEERIAKSARPDEIYERLPAYMINISPFREDYAARKALQDAKRMQSDPAALAELLRDVDELRLRLPEVAAAGRDLALLVSHLTSSIAAGTRPRVTVIAALEYLRNPFDDVFDSQKPHGYDDDLNLVRVAARELRGTGSQTRGNALVKQNRYAAA